MSKRSFICINSCSPSLALLLELCLLLNELNKCNVLKSSHNHRSYPIQSMEKLSSMKPVPGDKKVRDCCSRARVPTSPFFDQRIKLSFASESNLVSFYWLKQHRAGRLLLRTDAKGLITNSGDPHRTGHGLFACTCCLGSRLGISGFGRLLQG